MATSQQEPAAAEHACGREEMLPLNAALEPEPEPAPAVEDAGGATTVGDVVLEDADIEGANRQPLTGGAAGSSARVLGTTTSGETPHVGAFSSGTLRSLKLMPSRKQIRSKCADAALLTTGLFMLTMLLSVVLSIVWGLSDGVSGEACSERTCKTCEHEKGCVWCPGPRTSMPGYCEEKSLVNDEICNATSVATVEEKCAGRSIWDECAMDEAACNAAAACEWCGGMQQGCVPAGSSAPPNGSFCLDTGMLNQTTLVLSNAHRACQSTRSNVSWDHRRREWVDRSSLDNRSSTEDVLAANHTYHTDISCLWSFECGFNETVVMTVQHVNLDYNSELIVFDGATTATAGQLAYFTKFSGDRDNPDGALATAVSGSPSSHLLPSTGPVMTVQFTSGATDAQTSYTKRTGNISFPGNLAHDGFYITYKCAAPTSFYGRAGFYFLGVWAVAIAIFLRKAYNAIRYSAKTGGLWKMNIQELCTLCEAMDQTQPPPDPQKVCKGELIARITQSDQWPDHEMVEGLALSSFEDLETDDAEPWIDISWYSPYFLIDCASCIACTAEGFTDMLFLVMQFYRPDYAGLKTAMAALAITMLSTFMYLAPPGVGCFSTMVFRERFTFHQAKTWVWNNARTPEGKHLQTRADWIAWLQTPAGKHRPAGLGSELHNDYHNILPVDGRKSCGCKRSFRKKHDPDPTAEFDTGVDALGDRCGVEAKTEALPASKRTARAAFDMGWTSYAQFLAEEGKRADKTLEDAEKLALEASDLQDPTLWSQATALATAATQKLTTVASSVAQTAAEKAGTGAEAILPQTAQKAVGTISTAAATVVGGLSRGGATIAGGVSQGVGLIGNAATTKVNQLVRWKEEKGSEPGWLCGRPPQTKWDSDYFEMVYGRPSTPLMYILTILQCRVAVEGMIAWRNIAMLKAKRTKLGMGELEVLKVREKDFQRARRGLDMALLREGIFEALPQSVLEFQNLFRDKYTVLDLMSIPGVPVLTNISEYQLTFAIMMVTIITATLDITTPYSTDSVSVGVSLYVSQLLQLWSRLLVIGSVFSMHKESDKDSNGLKWGICYMIATYLLTMLWFHLSETKQWFHNAEAIFRRRQQAVKYIIGMKTAEGHNTGTKSSVSIKLHDYSVPFRKNSWEQSVMIGTVDRATHSLSGEVAFAPGETVRVAHDATVLQNVTHLDIGLSEPSDSWRCSEVEIQNCATRTSYRFDTSQHLVWGDFNSPHHLMVDEGATTQEYTVTVRRTGTPGMKSRVQIQFVYSDHHNEEEFEVGTGRPIWKHSDWYTLDQSSTAQNLSKAETDVVLDLPVCLRISPPIKVLQRIQLRLEDTNDDKDHKMHCESVELFDYKTNKTHSFVVNCDVTRNALGFPQTMVTGGLTEGMDMLNMHAAGKAEKVLLFSFINLFTCTDKNLCTPPTSHAAFVLSFVRVLESAIVCVVFVPVVCLISQEECEVCSVSQTGCGDDVFSVDRVSAFEIKSFLAVYLSLCSFACLLAGAAAEKLGEYNEKKAHDRRISWTSAIKKVRKIKTLVSERNRHLNLVSRRKALREIWTNELTAAHRAALRLDGIETLEDFQRLEDTQVFKVCGVDVEKWMHGVNSSSAEEYPLSSEDFQSAARVVARGGESLDGDVSTTARLKRKEREVLHFCKHWKSNMVFLYVLLPLLLVVMALCGTTLYYVYVQWMEECRSVVLVSLVVAFGIIVICIRLALGKEEVYLFTGSSETEVKALLALLGILLVGAFLLGATDGDVSMRDDLRWHPFKVLASRCHRGDVWDAWNG